MSHSFNFALFLLPVFDQTRHSIPRLQSASVPNLKGLSWDEAEVKPLEQLCHHNFSLHLKTQNQLIFSVRAVIHAVGLNTVNRCLCVAHLSKVLSQA